MKLKSLTIVAALLFSSTAFAANTVTTITQVTNGVTLTTDVDYTVTDATTPFTSAGSINIVNTEHAVVILKNIKPSKVISSYLDYIYINGEKAVNDENCQVKMYAQGAIILPYDKDFKPLTCYTEENYGGESYNGYGLGNTGGYMNTLNTRSLNNNIRSFKLKRGYMVTFAVGTGGWGYSRCFIADKEDLEVSKVPAPLNGKISSYRVFKWHNAQKKGLASNGDAGANDALNTSWCYDWGQGNASRLPDHEWVPNHIYEDWPSSATCGGVSQSCHMKTNNEPRNESDDHPQSLETILNNWQNLMRTGMRLCSPSSWDGSDYWNGTGFIKSFLDEIDSRGWRCDIVDAHCYWNSGNFGYLQSHWWPSMKRPIWISEWIWGSSWGNNGCWGNGVTDTQILNTTKDILNTLNTMEAVERYAYWNSESKGHIYENGSLTELGKFYASMETGLGYNKKYEFIPKVVYKAPSDLTCTYTKKTNTVTLEWTDPNGDMLDSIVVECMLPNTTKPVKRGNVTPKDKSSKDDISYTFEETITDAGLYSYHVIEYYNGKKFTTSEASVSLSETAQAIGVLQFGHLRIGDAESINTTIEAQDTPPYVVVGMISNKNSGNGITNQIQAISKTSFTFRFYPWTLPTPVNFNYAETADYMILPPNKVYHLNNQMMIISQKAGNVKSTEAEFIFPEPFPEGVTPVVVAQQNTTVASYAPVTVKVYDVTNTGFKAKLVRQEGVTSNFNPQNVNYFACSPGQIPIGGGKLLTVGRDYDTPCGGNARQTVVFKNAVGDTLHLLNPYIIAASQTDNYDKASIMRIHNTQSDAEGRIISASIRRQVDTTSSSNTTNSANLNGDYIGWMIISDDPNGTGDESPLITPDGVGIKSALWDKGFCVSVDKSAIHTDNPNVRAYTINGSQVAIGEPLPNGIYVVTDGKNSVKVQVR